MRTFFILAIMLAIIWFAWRMEKDMINDAPFDTMVLHLMLFFISFFVGLVLIE